MAEPMRLPTHLFLSLFLLNAVPFCQAVETPLPGRTHHNLQLEGTDGVRFSLPGLAEPLKIRLNEPAEQGANELERPPRLIVLCFLGTECPMAKSYGPKLQRMSNDYSASQVQFIGVMSNVQDSLEDAKKYKADHSISFEIGKDHDQKVADLFSATRTPETVVIDQKGLIRYRGRIDNQYQPGVARKRATEHDLRNALDALLDGRQPPKTETVATGCLIGRNQKKVTDFSVTYCREISRIMNSHCVECHRKGEIGPFRLDRYEDLIGWGEMCLEVISEDRMPPWHATEKYQRFANARKLPERDKRLLQHWVDAGMPYGESDDLPPEQTWVEGWRLPTSPDLVLHMSDSPFAVPAEGTVEYQYFVVDPKFKEDKWISAAEVMPGNASVVHHCIVFIRPPDGSGTRQSGLLSAYVPGQIRSPLPAGFAQRIPAGSRLVFQMHYTPNGQPQSDRTRLGLVFAEPTQVTHEVMAIGGIEQSFEIPPHANHHQVEGNVSWHPSDGYLISIMPHMHLRGKSFQFNAQTDQGTETLLEVPAYDFNWQHSYELAQPLPLGTIESLRFTATFDNSSDNPHNPDPSQTVTWGDQTWQEMAVVYLNIARPLNGHRLDSPRDTSETPSGSPQGTTEMRLNQEKKHNRTAERFAQHYLARLDKNKDGYLEQHEVPTATSVFLFRRMDRDRNGRVDFSEIKNEAMKRREIPDISSDDTLDQ